MAAPLHRWLEPQLKALLNERRIVLLEGARQSGKTTLIKGLQSANCVYRTLDDPALLAAAQSDPLGFIRHGDELLLIDEVQRAPALLPAIKLDVDENQKPGRFLLTGSAHIHALPAVQESLAGRAGKLRLRTLAQGEQQGSASTLLTACFSGELTVYGHALQSRAKSIGKDDYLRLALRGGYPEALQLNSERANRAWYRDYLALLLARDLRDVINIRRQDVMQKLLVVLAAWSSRYMDVVKIGTGLALQRPALESYINALEILYLVERVPAWSNTEYERVGKRDKLFMSDTGLMTALLRWDFDQVRFNGEANGKLLETWVFTQLAALLDIQPEPCKLYHYRDREQRELDFVVENAQGALLGIEVKAGSAVDSDSFKHLRWFKANMARDTAYTGIVLYTGEHVLSFGEGMWAVPMCGLWN